MKYLSYTACTLLLVGGVVLMVQGDRIHGTILAALAMIYARLIPDA